MENASFLPEPSLRLLDHQYPMSPMPSLMSQVWHFSFFACHFRDSLFVATSPREGKMINSPHSSSRMTMEEHHQPTNSWKAAKIPDGLGRVAPIGFVADEKPMWEHLLSCPFLLELRHREIRVERLCTELGVRIGLFKALTHWWESL